MEWGNANVGNENRSSTSLGMIATLITVVTLQAQDYVRYSQPKLFSYDELVQLSLNQEMTQS